MAVRKKNPKYIDFSQRLRQSASKVRLSQKATALSLKANPKTVGEWFNGIRLPNDKKMKALALLVKADHEWLANGDANTNDLNEDELEIIDKDCERESEQHIISESLEAVTDELVVKKRTKVTPEEKIKKIEARIKQLERKLKDKEDAVKIVVGEMVINLAEKDMAVVKFLLDGFNAQPTRKRDRKIVNEITSNLNKMLKNAS